MKTHMAGAAAVAVAVALLTACDSVIIPGKWVTGSGKLETREFALDGFTRVEGASAVQISVTRSDAFSVSVEADDNLWDRIEVVRVGSALKIYLKSGFSFRRTTVSATITMPNLVGLKLSGASKGAISGFSSDDFQCELSGASAVDGDLETDTADLELSGASRATLNGTVRRLRVDASGASRANLSGLQAIEASVDVSGASSTTVNVTGRLDASASGASSVRYRGNPTVGESDTSGASSIRPE